MYSSLHPPLFRGSCSLRAGASPSHLFSQPPLLEAMYLEKSLFTALLPLSAASSLGDIFSKTPRLKLLFSNLSSDLLFYPAVSYLFFFFFFFFAFFFFLSFFVFFFFFFFFVFFFFLLLRSCLLSKPVYLVMLLLSGPAFAQDLEPLLPVCCAGSLRLRCFSAVAWQARDLANPSGHFLWYQPWGTFCR